MGLLQCGFIANAPGEPGCSKEISSATPVPVSDAIQLSKVFPGGWGFGLAATADDRLYAWGVNQATMLGKSGDADAGSDPTTLDLVAEGVTTAAGGFDHALIVQQGKVSVFGPTFKSSSGSLLTPIDLPEQAVAVAAGEHHSLILTAQGNVYALGSNREGQLGVASTGTESIAPVLILGPASAASDPAMRAPIAAIAAGARHSLAATAEGQVFAWGCSLHGQCGTGVVTPAVPSPTLVSALGPLRCVGIAAGMAHSAVLTDSGDVYAWGNGAEGQLGDGSGAGCVAPKLVEALGGDVDDVVKVAAGGRHCVALCRSGTAYAWGFGQFGQLGSGAFGNGATPQKIAVQGGKKVADVAAGWWHTVVLTE